MWPVREESRLEKPATTESVGGTDGFCYTTCRITLWSSLTTIANGAVVKTRM